MAFGEVEDNEEHLPAAPSGKAVLYVQSCGDVGHEAFREAMGADDPIEKLTIRATLATEPDGFGAADLVAGERRFEAREFDDSGRQPGTWRYAD